MKKRLSNIILSTNVAEPKKPLADVIIANEKEIKDLTESLSDKIGKPDELSAIANSIDKLLQLRSRLQIIQSRVYLLQRTQERMKQIVDKSMLTHKFILCIAIMTVIFAGLLFALMFKEALIALDSKNPEQTLSSGVLSTIFGGLGVVDIFILMKYVMNRAQRALSDMVQTVIAYNAFKQQSDSLLGYVYQNDDKEKQISVDDLIKINNSLQSASNVAINNLQKYTEIFEEPKSPNKKTTNKPKTTPEEE